MFDLIPFGNKNGLARRDAFQNLMDRFFNDDFFAPSRFGFGGNLFKVDVRETEDAYVVEADLPGVKKEDVDIQYDNNYLTISARSESTVEKKEENFVRQERHSGELRRSFYVDNIDENKIAASLTDGVLKVTLPKKDKEVPDVKKIEIQ